MLLLNGKLVKNETVECNPLACILYSYEGQQTRRVIRDGEVVAIKFDKYVSNSSKEVMKRIVLGVTGAVITYTMLVLVIGLWG